jgi:hypothetical protein
MGITRSSLVVCHCRISALFIARIVYYISSNTRYWLHRFRRLDTIYHVFCNKTALDCRRDDFDARQLLL